MNSLNYYAGGNASYNITVNSATQIFAEAKNGKNDNWTDLFVNGAKSAEINRNDYEISAENRNLNISNWVGFGDEVDYFEVKISDAGKYNFDITATDNSYFTIYQLLDSGYGNYLIPQQYTYIIKNYGEDEAKATSYDLLLDAGTYYVSMNSLNYYAGGNASYNITVNSATQIFAEAKNGKNDNWTDLFVNGAKSAEINRNNYEISAENRNLNISNWVGFGDEVDYFEVKISDAGKYNFDITATDNCSFTIYQLLDSGYGNYLIPQQYTYIIKNYGEDEAKATSYDLLLDAGTYYVSMNSLNYYAGGNASYNITVNSATQIFAEAKNGKNDNWTDLFVNGAKSAEINRNNYEISAENRNLNISNWVGFGDDVDYFEVKISDAGKYNFDITATDNCYFTIYQLLDTGYGNYLIPQQYTYIIKNYGEDEAKATSYDLLLDAGTYYVSMNSLNYYAGGSADYSIKLNDSTEIFEKAKYGKEDDLTNVTFEGENLESKRIANSEDAAAFAVSDWVGFGDNTDYKKFTLDGCAALSFTAEATDYSMLSICRLDSYTGGDGKEYYYWTTLQSTVLYQNSESKYSADSYEILLGKGTYFLRMDSLTGYYGGSADYEIKINSAKFALSNDRERNFSNNSDDTFQSAAEQTAADTLHNWVGYGDYIDYFKTEITESGKISFQCDEQTLTALKNYELYLACYNEYGGYIALRNEGNSYISWNNVEAGTYYLEVQCLNQYAYSTEYDIKVSVIA